MPNAKKLVSKIFKTVFSVSKDAESFIYEASLHAGSGVGVGVGVVVVDLKKEFLNSKAVCGSVSFQSIA